jgi:pulcherriminic acid synthase
MRKVTPADLRTEEFLRNPFPVWKRLREEQPLFWDEPSGMWLLTRYDDVMKVLGDGAVYSARTYQERFRPVFGRTLAELDGPRHIRERTIVAPAFVGKALESYLPLIAAAVGRLRDALQGRGEFDLVDTVTSRLPLGTISNLLGFDEDKLDMLFEVGTTMLAGLGGTPEAQARAREAHFRLAGHLEPILEDRAASPRDDLISKIVGAKVEGDSLSREEICSFISFLLAAGGPTTDMAIRNFWWTLLENPSRLEACRGGEEQIQRAFSESLRRDGAIVYEDRRTNIETEWYGRTIPADADVMICLGSANTDDQVFSRPEEFDPDRTDLLMGVERKYGIREGGVSGHMAFGLGSHFCMGYQLARAEVVASTSQLLLDLPSPRVRERQEFRINFYERTVPALPVSVG